MQDLQDSIINLKNKLTQLLQAIQTLAKAAPAGATPLAPVAPAAVTVTFTLSPGTTNPDQLIDFLTCTGQALYETGKSKLMEAEDNRFDLMVTQVVRFQEMLCAQSEMIGWSNPCKESSLIKGMESTVT
jgi:hypothetical protein